MKFLTDFFTNRKLHKIAIENSINFEGGYYKSLQIHGQLVSDFGYLLRYYSGGVLDTFDSFANVYSLKAEIINSIDQDIKSGNPREAEIGLTLEVAIINLKNLRGIVHSISNYHEACVAAGVPSPDF